MKTLKISSCTSCPSCGTDNNVTFYECYRLKRKIGWISNVDEQEETGDKVLPTWCPLEDMPAPVKKWLRFTYKIEDSESGLFGRVLSYLFIERRAFYAEPWPDNQWAIYLKAEGDNLKRMGEIGREAGLRPAAFQEVQLEI